MQQDSRVAVVQMAATEGQIDLNLEKIIALSREAASAGAQIIVFPELALSGYFHKNIAQYALSTEDPPIRQLAAAAHELQAALLVGFAERSEDAEKPYISQLIALPDGSLEVYRKIHLGRFEKASFNAGTEFPVFSSHGIKFAVGICWDWHFPEVAAIYSLKGAEVLLAPHASLLISGDRRQIWCKYMGARAYDNSVYVAACNLTGCDSNGREFSGGAVIWDPRGEIIAQTGDQAEPILYADLSARVINDLRSGEKKSMRDSFFLAYRKKDLYHELLELEAGQD